MVVFMSSDCNGPGAVCKEGRDCLCIDIFCKFTQKILHSLPFASDPANLKGQSMRALAFAIRVLVSFESL